MRMCVDVCVRDHTSIQLCMHVLRSCAPGAQRVPHEGSMTALRDGLVHPAFMQSYTRKTADGKGSSSNVIILVYNWVYIYIYSYIVICIYTYMLIDTYIWFRIVDRGMGWLGAWVVALGGSWIVWLVVVRRLFWPREVCTCVCLSVCLSVVCM